MKDNTKIKDVVRAKVEALVTKKLEESKKMKEEMQVSDDKTQAPATVKSDKDEAKLDDKGASQDDMKVKYEEAEGDEEVKKEAEGEEEVKKEEMEVDVDKTQAPATESPEDKAPTKPEGASQDDMKVKYEEAEGDEEVKKEAEGDDEEKTEAATQDDMAVKNSDEETKMEAEDSEEVIEESEGDKSDMDKVVEILEALKCQVDENSQKLKEMTKEDEMPEAPMSESFYKATSLKKEKTKATMGQLFKNL